MVKSGAVSVLLVIFASFHLKSTSGVKEVLVRDRLVFLLCDQMAEYMETGEYPEPIKVMPEKYKKMRPGLHGKSEEDNGLGVKSDESKGLGAGSDEDKELTVMSDEDKELTVMSEEDKGRSMKIHVQGKKDKSTKKNKSAKHKGKGRGSKDKKKNKSKRESHFYDDHEVILDLADE